MWFSEYLFLERSWAKDESILQVSMHRMILTTMHAFIDSFKSIVTHINLVVCMQLGLQRLKDYPLPFWLALFVEGTRFTQAKLLAAQEYATSTGLPVPRNVLIPRTKV